MAVEKYTKVRDFNPQLLLEEVEAISPPIPAFQQSFPGFDRAAEPNRHLATPMAESTRPVAIRNGVPTDVAVKGEVRYETRNPLTVAQVTAIDTALDAHDETGDSTEQANQKRIQGDIATLRARLPSITDPDVALIGQLTLDLADDVF